MRKVIREEEELVAFDGPANVASDIVVGKVSYGRVEERTGVERAVLKELVGCAMEIVGARLDHHVDDCAGRAAKFGIVVGGGDAHLSEWLPPA